MSFGTFTLQNAATANGNGTVQPLVGFDSALLEIVETAGGTATVTIEGSFDGGANWYAVGYQRIDAQATPARAVTGISVTANIAQVFQLLDAYPQVRARISSIASGGTVTARLFAA